MQKRSNFSSKLGFVLAASGSAVGLGNIWRFPYLAAKYGGGTFLLIYLILAVTFGFALMTAEIALGRKTGLSAIGAFKSLDKRFGFLGVLASIVPIIIFPYYSVIGGWVIKYFAVFISGGSAASAGDTYFSDFIGGTFEPLGWFLPVHGKPGYPAHHLGCRGFRRLERAARASVRSAREPFGVAVGAQVLDLCALPSSKSLEKHHVHELCALRNRTA